MKLILWRHNHNRNAIKLEKLALRSYDLTIVLKGTLTYRINGKKLVVRDNEIICIKPNNFRERKESINPVNYISFNFQTDEPIDLPLYIPQAVTHEIKLLISCIDSITDNYHFNAKEQILYLLNCLILNLQSILKNNNEPIIVIKIKEYVTSHLSEKITLEQIGKDLHYNPLYCERLFKQNTGTTIISYIIQRRLKEAKRLILEGIPLNLIPELTGFESYSYFARTFKKYIDLTPLQYKKSLLPPDIYQKIIK